MYATAIIYIHFIISKDIYTSQLAKIYTIRKLNYNVNMFDVNILSILFDYA